MKQPKELIEIPEIKTFYQSFIKKAPMKLRRQIEGHISSADLVQFLNFFAELNLVALLSERGISFQYEQQNGIDFEFDNYVVSFKNLTEKGHIAKERQDTETILKENGGKIASSKFEYRNTKVEVTLDINGGYERIMTGSFRSGEAPKDDVVEKQKIIENLAGLEKVKTDKKKILFLFAQDETDDLEVAEVCLWYFDLTLNSHDFVRPETYASWFKARKDKSVEAIIFTQPFIHGIYKLVWYNGARPKIYTRSKDVREFFEALFSVGAIPAVL